MASKFETAGYPVRAGFDQLCADGRVFMHTINHPAMPLTWRIAASALGRTGLADPLAPDPGDVPDDLADSIILPVHPALARRIGVEESDVFVRSVPEAGEGPRALAMRDFAHASFAVYRQTDPIMFEQPHSAVIAARLATVLSPGRHRPARTR